MKIFCLTVVLLLAPATAMAACGDKGGPGYRGPNGKCVSWQKIGAVCGSPPEARCTPEMAHKDAAEAAQGGAKIQSLTGQAHKEKKN